MAIYKTLVKKIPISPNAKIKKKDYLLQGKLAVVDQGQSLIGGYSNFTDKQIQCDLPAIIFGDHTRSVKFINFPFGAGADGIKILTPKENISAKFLFYGTQYLVLRMPDKGYARHYQHLEKEDLYLPPLPEQERIVAHIEELFSELDAGVDTLKKAKAQLGVYRQAVLKEAFSSYKSQKSIEQMSSLVTSGSRGWAKYYAESGARFIRITDLTRNGIALKSDNIKYVSLPTNTEGKRSRLKPHDVLVSITADLGSIALVPHNIEEAYINQHIALIRFDNSVQGEFMAWYLRSEHGQKDLLKNKRGAGKLGLGLDDIRITKVPVVSDNAAKATILEIESRLSVCDSIERTIDDALEQARALQHSILKDAFEGELFHGETATNVRD